MYPYTCARSQRDPDSLDGISTKTQTLGDTPQSRFRTSEVVPFPGTGCEGLRSCVVVNRVTDKDEIRDSCLLKEGVRTEDRDGNGYLVLELLPPHPSSRRQFTPVFLQKDPWRCVSRCRGGDGVRPPGPRSRYVSVSSRVSGDPNRSLTLVGVWVKDNPPPRFSSR